MSRGSALGEDSIVGFLCLSLVSLVLSKELNKNEQGLRPWGGFYCWVSFFSLVSLVLQKQLNKNEQGIERLRVALRGLVGSCSDATEAADAKRGSRAFQNFFVCQKRTSRTEDMVSIVERGLSDQLYTVWTACLTYIQTTSRRAVGPTRKL